MPRKFVTHGITCILVRKQISLMIDSVELLITAINIGESYYLYDASNLVYGQNGGEIDVLSQ